MKTITLLLSIIFSLPLFGQHLFKGKVFEEDLPDGITRDNLDFPRERDVLPIESVIKMADDFLKGYFGENFELQMDYVSLKKRFRPNGILWCWHVTYRYPQQGKKNEDHFLTITLSLEGKPLMSVTNPKE